MVYVSEEGNALCIIRDMTTTNSNGTTQNRIQLTLPATTTVQELFEEVGRKYQYNPLTFELILQKNAEGDSVVLNDHKEKTIEAAGVNFDSGARNTFILANMASTSNHKIPVTVTSVGDSGEDDMMLGASASPTAGGDYVAHGPPNPPLPAITAGPCTDYSYTSTIIKHDTGYVGLVNQAMTCYLNSLLQALFMTPEFRNALYSWQFKGQPHEETKSIPYQLQKLFLNLQTSEKSAVETTELTRSFGWDSSEAWQQHDIQELCRVMFDALEQTFKNTQQADLILNLYEGKMIDYVKCLECSTEKSREDTFLDIPLPVRPFGSTVAYGSVEEALRAFVQPETLDGNNQYHCDKCAKKCDAHKGLKFSKFPYLLTLHLKRFDFDYTTLHRIKLNDKVTFPELLNLNSFITSANCKDESECATEKNDDSSTTDSGSALDDESQGPETAPISQHQELPDYQEDDEGIDCGNGANHLENEKNRLHMLAKGPYMYELFSIMIHSGSASGGHYYAYIMDFKGGEWYCYNDQSVSRITDDDIRKTYGGGPQRGYYSGAYTSSTNAYMLMYRQIDKQRNCDAISVDELPPHISELLQRVRQTEETDRKMREKEMEMCKLKLYARHPTQNQVVESKLYCLDDVTLEAATEMAYRNLHMEDVVPLDRCRLVNYDRLQDSIECSFEGRESEFISEILNGLTSNFKYDLLLEIRKENAKFEIYQPGGVATKVFVVDVVTQEVDGPTIVRGNLSQTVGEFKHTLAKALNLNAETIKVVLEKYSNEPRLLDNDSQTLKFEGFYGSNKIFVASAIDDDPEKPFIVSKLHKLIDRFEHIITLHMVLPNTDKETLEKLMIPVPSEEGCIPGVTLGVEAMEVSVSEISLHPPRDASPQPALDVEDEALGATGHSDQSNSEDSSLTDSERTLVGDLPNDEGLVPLSSPSNSSPGSDPQNISSPEEGQRVSLHTFAKDDVPEIWDDDEDSAIASDKRRMNYYFKASVYTDDADQKMLKVLVDKRMILGSLKRGVEPYVGVPIEYFKIYRVYSGQQEFECSRLTESLSSYRDDETLWIKLGRALRKGEHRGKIYQLLPNETEPMKFLCDWILGKETTIREAKRDILAELKQKYSMDIPMERCRLRKKSWKNPSKVHRDEEKFDDIGLLANWELFLQELPEPEPVTSPDQMVLFVRRWCPAALELQPFNEVVLDSSSVEELKNKLSTLSGIPVENVEFAKPMGSFPCETSVLGIHTDLEWNAQTTQLDNWPLNINDDGHVIFYRDSREELKQLTVEERKERSNKEASRSSRHGNKSSTYSPRKERALKIYLDTSPKKDELDLD